MDLKDLDFSAAADEGVLVDVYHPITNAVLTNSDGSKWQVKVVGEYSERYKKAQNKITNRRLASKSKAKFTAEELEAEQTEMFLQCLIGWQGFMRDGVPLPFTAEAARALLSNPSFSWLRKQIDEAVHDLTNFSKQ